MCNVQSTGLPHCLLSPLVLLALPELLPACPDAATCKCYDLLAPLAAFSASHLSFVLPCWISRPDCWLPVEIAAAGPDGSAHCQPLPSSAHVMSLSPKPEVPATCRGGVPQVNLSVLNKPVINSTLPTNVTTSNSTTLTFTTAKNTTTVFCSSCCRGMLALSDIQQHSFELASRRLPVQQPAVAIVKEVSGLCAEHWPVKAACAVAASPGSKRKVAHDNAAICCHVMEAHCCCCCAIALYQHLIQGLLQLLCLTSHLVIGTTPGAARLGLYADHGSSVAAVKGTSAML